MRSQASDTPSLRTLLQDGCALLSGVFDAVAVEALRRSVQSALAVDADSVRQRNDQVYAARNLLDLWPQARTVWQHPTLIAVLQGALGPKSGLVRGLYFDKPPDQTWALPWHKDLLIAIDRSSRSTVLPALAAL